MFARNCCCELFVKNSIIGVLYRIVTSVIVSKLFFKSKVIASHVYWCFILFFANFHRVILSKPNIPLNSQGICADYLTKFLHMAINLCMDFKKKLVGEDAGREIYWRLANYFNSLSGHSIGEHYIYHTRRPTLSCTFRLRTYR
jgi:hypothetical protein